MHASLGSFSSSLTARLIAVAVAVAACSSSQPSPEPGLPVDGHVDGGVDAAAVSPTDGAADRTPDGPSKCVPTGPEMCDGHDNNCDGVVDDGFTWQGMRVGAHCYPGVGACLATGTVVCENPSTATCSATAGSPDETFHTTAAPNGSWDWNCNNNVDRQYPLSSCESFTAATCPPQGWAPPAGESGDCGEMLVQSSCSTTPSGCASTGASTTVTEACK